MTKKLAKGEKKKFSLKLSAKARAAIKRALKRHKGVSAKLTIAAHDASGNTRRQRRTVKFKR